MPLLCDTAAASLLDLASRDLRRAVWSVYYLATCPGTEMQVPQDRHTHLGPQEALELLRTLPLKEWSHTTPTGKRPAAPSPRMPYRQAQGSTLFQQYVDGKLTRESSLNSDCSTPPFVDGPYMSFGAPRQFSDESELFVVLPDITYRKSDIQHLL
jgi:hypothetical protein